MYIAEHNTRRLSVDNIILPISASVCQIYNKSNTEVYYINNQKNNSPPLYSLPQQVVVNTSSPSSYHTISIYISVDKNKYCT